MKVLTHKHEVLSGKTSSLSYHVIFNLFNLYYKNILYNQLLGFDSQGNVINNSDININPSWEEIVNYSTKVLTFIDVGGHEKYANKMI